MRPPTASLCRTALTSALSGSRNLNSITASSFSRTLLSILSPTGSENSFSRSYSSAEILNAVRSTKLTGPRFRAQRPNSILKQICFRQATNRSQSTAPNSSEVSRSQNTNDDSHSQEVEGFGRSEKASKAAQVNLSASLRRDSGGIGKPAVSEIVRLLRVARPEAKWLAGAFLLLLVSSAVTMSIPFSIGKILDVATKAAEGDKLFGLTMPQFYSGLAGVLFIGAACNYGRIIMLRIVGERIVTRLRSRLFKKAYTQDAEFFDANRVGDLISRLSSDTIIVGKSITQNISDGLRALVSGCAGLGAMAYVSLKLTGILSIMFPPIAIIAFVYGRSIRSLSRKIQRNLGTLSKIAEERLSNVRTSQAFVGEILEVHRYSTQVRKIFNLGKREAIISASFFSTTGLIGNSTILAILYIGSQQVKSGIISIGELTSFLMYTAYAGSSLFGLSSFYSELMKGVGAASRLYELQDREPNIKATIGNKVVSARGVITFENVKFSYPTRPAVTIFDGLSLSIPPGTNVAIVGPSGGGKSTITSLLLRFYDPVEGSIKINGVDIRIMNLKSLRRRIGVVAQEPVLFSGSIAENIAYGKPNATKIEIIRAARKANCQFIADFPDGLDTQVGARGAMLSGGQKQRIAIARALIKDPDILILDEATSALDAESETLVNEALTKLMQGSSTTISIAHRLSTIKRSDTIIVLGADGKVAEQGTYKELTSKDGAFSRLMEWQITGGEGNAQSTRKEHDDFEPLDERENEERERDESGEVGYESEIEEDEVDKEAAKEAVIKAGETTTPVVEEKR